MNDLDKIREALRQFAAEREWDQYHSPKNLAAALAVESAELLEPFQWLTEEESRNLDPERLEAVREEMADVFIYLLHLADKLSIDILLAAREKIAKNAAKYRVDDASGSSRTHSEFDNCR